MADFDVGAVESLLRREAAARGVTYDPSDLEGIIRNTSYSVGGSTLEAAVANQVRIYDVRAAPTSQRTVDSQSAQGQALYGSGADLRPTYVPLTTAAQQVIAAAIAPPPPPPAPALQPATAVQSAPTTPTIMMSGGTGDLYTDPGRALLAGELTTTSLPNRAYGNALAGAPSQAIGGGGAPIADTVAAFPPWVWLAAAGGVAFLLWKR